MTHTAESTIDMKFATNNVHNNKLKTTLTTIPYSDHDSKDKNSSGCNKLTNTAIKLSIANVWKSTGCLFTLLS